MRRAVMLAVLLGGFGCSKGPFVAHLTAPVAVTFQPGAEDNLFYLFQDGPDDDMGVFDVYVKGLTDETATKLGYRREDRRSGGKIYLLVIIDGGAGCTFDIAKPSDSLIKFDNECGAGEIDVPVL